MTSFAPPSRVPAGSARVREETEDGGFRVGIVIDRESHGTDLLLGLEWIAVGTEPVSWKAPGDAHETYYVNKGRMRVAWDGDEAGEAILSEGDAFYFPPARTYTVENMGDEEVFVVWSIIPSP